MFAISRVARIITAAKEPKYPHQIEFHRLPWKCLPPTSALTHKHTASKYFQLLHLASRSDVPLLLNDFHPDIDETRIESILPGMVYIVPELRTLFGADPLEWGPYQWHGTKLSEADFMMHYGAISSKIAVVDEVWEFVSQERTMLCTALCMRVPHGHCCPGSTLHEVSKDQKDFVLFHFYNPNRPASELVKPLMRYYQHKPCMCKVSDFIGISSKKEWVPKAVPQRPKGTKASPQPDGKAPPDTYWNGIQERNAAYPGFCFGTRKNCWGMGT